MSPGKAGHARPEPGARHAGSASFPMNEMAGGVWADVPAP
ncbi:hypothetical protein BN2497_2081 [Janthinobacterium sp. CG23_2]|nr:hypothetical protein BN2497_2081 [Janthinobacterium sp. CG23_2]CUU27438.1 hypothetical protein BN3177_2081 [Janthinobacterium sp. CG23_2]